MLSGRGLCDELITRPEESYRLWCVIVCDLENPLNKEALPQWRMLCQKKKSFFFFKLTITEVLRRNLMYTFFLNCCVFYVDSTDGNDAHDLVNHFFSQFLPMCFAATGLKYFGHIPRVLQCRHSCNTLRIAETCSAERIVELYFILAYSSTDHPSLARLSPSKTKEKPRN